MRVDSLPEETGARPRPRPRAGRMRCVAICLVAAVALASSPRPAQVSRSLCAGALRSALNRAHTGLSV